MEQYQGSVKELRVPTHRLASMLLRRVQPLLRVQDLVARLPLPNLFMRQDVLFIGYLEAGLGLGESLRGLVRAVATTRLPFALYPFNVGVESRFIGGFMEHRYDLKHRHRINVIEMAVDQLPAMFRHMGKWKTAHSYNILRTYWELAEAPSEWTSLLRDIHEIWVPNEFVQKSFSNIFDGIIRVVPPYVDTEAESYCGREHFCLDHTAFYFIYSFDYFSCPARKNPLGVVRAFQAAFPDPAERVGLVIKSTSAEDQYLEIKSAIFEAAQRDPRIKVLDRTLSRNEILSLIRASDCYISLHRSEGFGLGMAEAMAFAKPVIGTDYSGSTVFLSDLTGFPVSFTMRPVLPGEYVFADNQSWAEPDHAAAVVAMQRVFCDIGERQRRAAAGKAFMEKYYGRATVASIVAQRLEEVLATP